MTVTDGVASEEALVDWEGVQGGDELLFSIESERGEDENAGISADVCEWETLCDWQTFGTGKVMNNIYLLYLASANTDDQSPRTFMSVTLNC